MEETRVLDLLKSLVSTSSKKHNLTSLNSFCRLLQSYPAICDPSKSQLTSGEVFCCLRTALFHETYEVRAAGLRAIRYLLKDEQAVKALLKVNLHLLIVRSIDVVLGNDEERHQALRLVRKLLSIAPHLFPRAFTRSMMAIAQDGIPHKDNLTRVCWALLAELSILNPEASTLDTRNRAFNIILHAALAPYNQPHSISESLVSTLLYMLNWPKYRQLIRGDLDMQIFVAPFTDSHYTAPLFDERMEKPRNPHMNKHHRADRRVAYSDSSENKSPENRFTTAKNTLISILRSWPGLIYLNDQTPPKDFISENCLESLISMLYLPYNEIRRRLIDLISELLSVPIPDWTNNFEMGLKSLELHQISRDSWKIHDAFVVDEAKSILSPIRSRSRMNLVTNYVALLLLALFHCDIVNALSVVIVSSSSQENSFRATILLGQLLQLSSQYLPPDCISKYLSLPTLISAATSKSEEHRDLANAALTNLDRIHGLKKSSESLPTCSLFLGQILQFCSPKSTTNNYQRGTSTRSSSMSSSSSTSTLSSLSSVMPHLNASGSLRPHSLSIYPNYSSSTSATSNPQSSNVTGSTNYPSSNASTPSSQGASKTPTKNSLPSPSQGGHFPALYSKFALGKLKFQQYIRTDKGDKSFHATIKMMNLSNPEQEFAGNPPQQQQQQSSHYHHPQQSASQDWQDWDWYVIGCTLNRPSESLKKLSTQLHKAFIKRLIHFFKPSSNQYSSIDINNERARQYCEIGCHLIDFLIECEDIRTLDFLEELLNDIAQSMTIMDGHNMMTCDMASSSKLISTLSSSYFLFIGRLSSTTKGYQLLDRTGIISLINNLIQLSMQNPSSPAEVHVRLIISCFDYTKEFNGSRKLLERFLFEHPEESVRIYATNFLRVLSRAGVKDFSSWCMELLVRQLNNSSRIVHHAAVEILDEACDLNENLEGLIALKHIITSTMSTSGSTTSKLSSYNGSAKDSPMMNHSTKYHQQQSLMSPQDVDSSLRYKYMRMSVIQVLRSSGDSGVLLLCRFASSSSGLKYLMETPHKHRSSPHDYMASSSSRPLVSDLNQAASPSSVNGGNQQQNSKHSLGSITEFDYELNQWIRIYNYRYVKIVEDVLNNSLTYHQKSEDGRYGRRIDKINPLTKNSDLPSHLYGQLAQHSEGVQILISKNLLDPIYKIIRSPPKDLETSELSVLKFKAALWIIGHVGSAECGYQLLDEVEIISKIVGIARSANVLSLRGTAYYVLGLLASTEDGAEQLKLHGWAAMQKEKLALPLRLELILIRPKEDQSDQDTNSSNMNNITANAAPNHTLPNKSGSGANSHQMMSNKDAAANNNNNADITLANALSESRISSSTLASGHSCSTTDNIGGATINNANINPTIISNNLTYYEMHKKADCLFCSNLSNTVTQPSNDAATSTNTTGTSAACEPISVLAANFSSSQLLQVRREVLRLSYFLVTGNFSSSFFESVEKVENSLLNLKRKFGLLFQHDLCLYSDVCQQLATYNFPLLSRRFLQELFLDITFDPLNEDVKRILNKES